MVRLEEFLQIETPENVAFDYEVAGVGSRFLAAVVDTLLLLVLLLAVNLALRLVLIVGEWLPALSEEWVVAIFGLVSFAFFWGYYIFFELIWNGQSPGKRWVGLRVIRTEGTPISLTESLIRNLVRLVDFMPALYGAGVVTMFLNRQARRLGDLAAGTLVVWDRPVVTLESLRVRPVVDLPRPAVVLPIEWPLERLSDQDLQMAVSYIRRRKEIQPYARSLGPEMARFLLQKMALSPHQVRGMSADDVIIAVLRAAYGLDEALRPAGEEIEPNFGQGEPDR